VVIRALFTRYILATILVVLGMALLIWLGFWQLDRQEQKRTFNTLMAERWRMEPFDLTTFALPADLSAMEYRRVAAAGDWDYDNQLLISNQTFNGSAGYVVVTPLVLGENRAVLVARGWIPSDLAPPEKWPEIEEAPGAAVLGLVRQSQGLPSGEPSTPVSIPQREYYRIDIPAIQGQMPYQLEAGYLEQMPEEGRTVTQFPLRREPMALDEGNHLSYAIQWFTFAAVLGFGYIMLVRHQVRRAAGLIVPATHTYQPLGEDEPVAPPVAVSQQEPKASAPAPDAVSETDRLYA
jgi:surfeit locus 1 family protein